MPTGQLDEGPALAMPHGTSAVSNYHVDALSQTLDRLGVERFHLLGNSLVGAAAPAMAHATPQTVAGLVLMARGGWLFLAAEAAWA